MMIKNSDKQEDSYFSSQKLSSPRNAASLEEDSTLSSVNQSAADIKTQIRGYNTTCYAENTAFEKVQYSFEITRKGSASSN